MWKRIILFSFIGLISSISHAKTYTVGLSTWSSYPGSVKGFKEILTNAGFIEGKNITYVLRNAKGDRQRQTQIAKEFTQQNVDLVYSLTTPGTSIIKDTLPETTPVVFSVVTYPADAGLIESFEYSGNNLVGTSNFVPLHHYVNLLKTILPKVKSVAIFHRTGEPNSKLQAVNMTRLLKREGIKVIDKTATSIEELEKEAAQVVTEVGAFITTTDTLLQGGGEKSLIKIAREHKLPILSSNKSGIEDGSTFGPVADFYQLGKMSGEMAVKILKGEANPSDLQSRLQSSPTVLVNSSSIKDLKLKVPQSLTDVIYVK